MQNGHPDAVFGPDEGGENVNYASLARQLINMKASALTPANYDDVLTIIEWLRDETIRRYADLETCLTEVKQREEHVAKREQELKLRSRAVDMILRNPAGLPARKFGLFRRRA